MTIRKTLSALVAASIVFGSAASAATGADAVLRQSAPVEEGEQIAGAGLGWAIAIAVAAGIALVIIEDDEDDDEPESA